VVEGVLKVPPIKGQSTRSPPSSLIVIPGLSEAKNPEARAKAAPLMQSKLDAALGFVLRALRNDGFVLSVD
jgi:hypothetical protein